MTEWGNDTIAAISTPPGEGAIALVRLSGPEAVAVGDGEQRLQVTAGIDVLVTVRGQLDAHAGGALVEVGLVPGERVGEELPRQLFLNEERLARVRYVLDFIAHTREKRRLNIVEGSPKSRTNPL
jgi:hypothetical protein